MTACGHVYGEECLLRKLEKYGECPICRRERIGREHEEVESRRRSVETIERERELLEREIAAFLEPYTERSVESAETVREREFDGRVSRASFRRNGEAEEGESVAPVDVGRERVSDVTVSGATGRQELLEGENEEQEESDDEGSVDSFEAERERVSDGRISRLAFRRGE